MFLLSLTLTLCLFHTASSSCKTIHLQDWERAIFDAHNKLRALHNNTEPLCYASSDDSDVTFDTRWASTRVTKFRFRDAPSPGYTAGDYGENRAQYNKSMPNSSNRSIEFPVLINDWYSEVTNWNYTTSTGTGPTDRFTQIVWRNTTQVSCGFHAWGYKYTDPTYPETNRDLLARSVVCQYWPAGNTEGGYADNVAPLKPGDDGTDEPDVDPTPVDNSAARLFKAVLVTVMGAVVMYMD